MFNRFNFSYFGLANCITNRLIFGTLEMKIEEDGFCCQRWSCWIYVNCSHGYLRRVRVTNSCITKSVYKFQWLYNCQLDGTRFFFVWYDRCHLCEVPRQLKINKRGWNMNTYEHLNILTYRFLIKDQIFSYEALNSIRVGGCIFI